MNSFENNVQINGVELSVEYYYDRGEAMVMYYPDGSGHPGSPPSAEIQAVYAGDVDIYEILDTDILECIEERLIEIHE